MILKSVVDDGDLWFDLVKQVKPINFRNLYLGKNNKASFSNNNKRSNISYNFIKNFDTLKNSRIFPEKEVVLGDSRGIDRRTYLKFKKNFSIDARLDLHGMTLDIAYLKLIDFILYNFDNGVRNLLIITGVGNKGKGTGVIRQNLQGWLQNPDISGKILYFNNASIKDGGNGAFYIVLRKNR